MKKTDDPIQIVLDALKFVETAAYRICGVGLLSGTLKLSFPNPLVG